MADYLTTDTELTSVANAIRTKGGTSASLVYPAGFVSAINAISTGGVVVSDTTDSHGGTIRTITTTQTPVVLQAKTNITPSASSQTITPDSGYDALSSVQINGDADLVAGNIKKDVTIFGVTGSYEGSGGGSGIKHAVYEWNSGYEIFSRVSGDILSESEINKSYITGVESGCMLAKTYEDLGYVNYATADLDLGSVSIEYYTSGDHINLLPVFTIAPYLQTGDRLDVFVVPSN